MDALVFTKLVLCISPVFTSSCYYVTWKGFATTETVLKWLVTGSFELEKHSRSNILWIWYTPLVQDAGVQGVQAHPEKF